MLNLIFYDLQDNYSTGRGKNQALMTVCATFFHPFTAKKWEIFPFPPQKADNFVFCAILSNKTYNLWTSFLSFWLTDITGGLGDCRFEQGGNDKKSCVFELFLP